jgi:succinate dehydrogenase / fumarate reductase, cytochrome b subunit
VLVGLTWTFLQHLCSGVRHLLLDTGAGYELKRNKTGALATIAVSLILTIAIWGGIFARTTF